MTHLSRQPLTHPHRVARLLLAALIYATLPAQAQVAPQPTTADKPFAGRDNAVTQVSEKGLYKVTLHTDQVPIPITRIHRWILRLETPEGAPVEDATVFVYGQMPAHRHGFPTRPQVTGHLGGGEYAVDGIKFGMGGYWELRFSFRRDGTRDRVVFPFKLR